MACNRTGGCRDAVGRDANVDDLLGGYMTDQEIIRMAGEYGAWLNGTEIVFTDRGLVEFARAVAQAESEACAVAIEDLIPLLDPERKPTIFMCAYTCLNKYEPKEVGT
jgi:hypothetical protein